MSTSPVAQLHGITQVLLFCDDHPGTLRQAAEDLFTLFTRVSNSDDGSMAKMDQDANWLPTGKALNFTEAAHCVLDFARTSKFLRGAMAAIQEAQRRFPGEQISILYAGCGPFATLMVPITTQFNADEIRFTILEVNERSLESAQKVIDAFGLADYVAEFIHSDATVYVAPVQQPFHIVISETMQRALAREPQVSVMANLASQLCSGGLFIPQQITVDAYMFDASTEFALTKPNSTDHQPERMRLKLGRLVELAADNAAEFVSRARICKRSNVPCIDCGSIELPAGFAEHHDLMLSTEVTIFDSLVLGDYESGITLPVVLRRDRLNAGTKIDFRYCLGSDPGFKT